MPVLNTCTRTSACKICQWSVGHGRSIIIVASLQSQRQIAVRVWCVERVVQLCADICPRTNRTTIDEYPMILLLPVRACSNDA